MLPFGQKRKGPRLASSQGSAPMKLSVLTTIASPDIVVSPITGMRAAMVYVEILERTSVASNDGNADDYELLGTFVFGDLATLRDEDGDEITIVVGRARIAPQLPRTGGALLSRVPPEVVPLLAKASGLGTICYRELALSEGHKIRLKAMIEPTQSVAPSGTRSAPKSSYVARDDLGPVVLEEVFESPPG